jgi:DNA-damage-inducible protein J
LPVVASKLGITTQLYHCVDLLAMLIDGGGARTAALVPAGGSGGEPLKRWRSNCPLAGAVPMRYIVSQSASPRVIMTATTTMVHVRVDEHVKAQAAETLASMGLTVSDAIRVFLTRIVADKELPFAIKAPNATSRVAIAEARKIINSRRARFATADALIDDIEKASRK